MNNWNAKFIIAYKQENDKVFIWFLLCKRILLIIVAYLL